MPETLTTPTRAGLFTRSDVPVPLTGVSVVADIVSLCVRVTVTQRYVNHESHPIEAVYVFPLDEGAAVCGFEALVDGTLVVGEVMEREKAFATYDDAMQAGHGAYLLDEERPDVFQASVGNLPPGKEVLLKITYVAELDVQNGALRFVVPTTVAPRYAPSADHRGLGRPDAETLNPPRAWHVPYGLNLAVTVSMPGAIGRIESPSHPISMTVADGQTTVALGAEEVALDRDFVLSIAADGLDVPRAWIERDGDGQAAIAISYVPTLPESTQPAEVIFVVDESGSMQGSSIEQVKNALQLCLRSMIAGCRFNILSFGSNFVSLFPESRIYDEASLSAASAFVEGMTADRGGTEILPALRSVLEQTPSPELSRQVVVLTDGEVTNTDAVIALARSTRHDDACVHLRHRRRPEPAPRAGPGARRPRQRRVHRAWRAHRTEGRTPVRPAPGTCRHERGGALGRPGRGVRPVRHSAALRRRAARDLWLRERPEARDRDPHREGTGWADDLRTAHRSVFRGHGQDRRDARGPRTDS